MARTFMLFSTLLFVAVLAFLTFSVAFKDGVSVLVVISFIFIAMAGVGLVGALTNGPPRD